jgi:hypothetical protein
MVIIKETSENKLNNRERRRAPEVFKDLTPKIIDFEIGRKALEKGALEGEQGRARPAERIRLPRRLLDDWFELLLTMAMFFALLPGLYGLIGS